MAQAQSLDTITRNIVKADSKSISYQWQLARYVFVSLSGDSPKSQSELADLINSSFGKAYNGTAFKPLLQPQVSAYNKAWTLFGVFVEQLTGNYAPAVAGKVKFNMKTGTIPTTLDDAQALWDTIGVKIHTDNQRRSTPSDGTTTDPDTGEVIGGGKDDTELMADLYGRVEKLARKLDMPVADIIDALAAMASVATSETD